MSRRLVHITTVPESLRFIEGQSTVMRSHGWEVQAISSPGPKLDLFGHQEGIETHGVEMPRSITPIRDLHSVSELAFLLHRLRPALVHAHTPKGGVLGMIAATIAGVPARIYHMRGLPFMTAAGHRRVLLTQTERIACGLAHHVISQSHSLREVALDHRLVPGNKIEVLHNGSNGVDSAGRFNPQASRSRRLELRKKLGISSDAVVVGFVGRLVKDKGIVELAAAWREVRLRCPWLRLVLVGPFETGDAVPPDVRAALESDSSVLLVGPQNDTPGWYAAMDIFVFPSHREGFPNAPLEAASMELPIVATQIAGCVDAIVDGVTGTLVPPRQARSLTEALIRYAESPDLRLAHGQAGRERVVRCFQRAHVSAALAQTYERIHAAQRQ